MSGSAKYPPPVGMDELKMKLVGGSSVTLVADLCHALELHPGLGSEFTTSKYLREEDGSGMRSGHVRTPYSTRVVKHLQDLVENGTGAFEKVGLAAQVEVLEVLCMQHDVIPTEKRRQLLETYESTKVKYPGLEKQEMFHRLAGCLETFPHENKDALLAFCSMVRTGTQDHQKEIATSWAGRLLLLGLGRFHPVKPESYRVGENAIGIMGLCITYFGVLPPPQPLSVETELPTLDTNDSGLTPEMFMTPNSAKSFQSPLSSVGSPSSLSDVAIELSTSPTSSARGSGNSSSKKKKSYFGSLKSKITNAFRQSYGGAMDTHENGTEVINPLGHGSEELRNRPKSLSVQSSSFELGETEYRNLLSRDPLSVAACIEVYGRPPPPPPMTGAPVVSSIKPVEVDGETEATAHRNSIESTKSSSSQTKLVAAPDVQALSSSAINASLAGGESGLPLEVNLTALSLGENGKNKSVRNVESRDYSESMDLL